MLWLPHPTNPQHWLLGYHNNTLVCEIGFQNQENAYIQPIGNYIVTGKINISFSTSTEEEAVARLKRIGEALIQE